MLLLLLILALAGASRSRLINVTIDDTLGDERTGLKPHYVGYSWDEYPEYSGFWDDDAATRGELSSAHNGTLSCRDPYYRTASASLTFNGTAIYFFIARRANASINMMFYRDGILMPVYQYFVHPELPNSDLESTESKFLYDQLAFKDDQLANEEHTVTFVLDGNTSYDACFDYAIYTMDDGLQSPNATTSLPGASSTDSTIPASAARAHADPPRSVLIAAAIVGGAVMAALSGDSHASRSAL